MPSILESADNELVDLHTARVSGVVIRCHAFDLSVTTPELLRQVDQLAATVSQTTVALSVGT
jgi:5-methylcytosine-specific restriction enzyme subunit McrC